MHSFFLEKENLLFNKSPGCRILYQIQHLVDDMNSFSRIEHGSEIRLRPSQDYKEYVYLLNFNNPGEVFRVLKGFPHVVYHGLTSGHWNTMVVTNRLLNFSKLVGFPILKNR